MESTNLAQNSTPAGMPDRQLVAQLAYAIFVKRGGQHGMDEQDWLEAERQLQGQQGIAPSAPQPNALESGQGPTGADAPSGAAGYIVPQNPSPGTGRKSNRRGAGATAKR